MNKPTNKPTLKSETYDYTKEILELIYEQPMKEILKDNYNKARKVGDIVLEIRKERIENED